jgi:hypothetical protein
LHSMSWKGIGQEESANDTKIAYPFPVLVVNMPMFESIVDLFSHFNRNLVVAIAHLHVAIDDLLP